MTQFKKKYDWEEKKERKEGERKKRKKEKFFSQEGETLGSSTHSGGSRAKRGTSPRLTKIFGWSKGF